MTQNYSEIPNYIPCLNYPDSLADTMKEVSARFASALQENKMDLKTGTVPIGSLEDERNVYLLFLFGLQEQMKLSIISIWSFMI